ncbi:hypothetical protein [uncultured Rummeliibacillus sp.]|uniref:hypothetical protein n=1 Tax=uncultured Rummeliibacillus sp. TaxID=762292 RepID=UPI002617B820|nr:hypothetical protein [uncultured Rummeliibacillus sp.]
MVSTVLITIYVCLSLIAIILWGYQQKKENTNTIKLITVIYYVVVHFLFFMMIVFMTISIQLFILLSILVISSRMLNGKVLFGQMHLSHHTFMLFLLFAIGIIRYSGY